MKLVVFALATLAAVALIVWSLDAFGLRFQTPIRSKQLLLAAAILSFAIALFQAVLSFSSSLTFFGAGELAANPLLLLVAGLAVTILFALSCLYARPGCPPRPARAHPRSQPDVDFGQH